MSKKKKNKRVGLGHMEKIDLSLRCPLGTGLLLKKAPSKVIYYNDLGEDTMPFVEAVVVEAFNLEEYGCFCTSAVDREVLEDLDKNVLNDAGYITVKDGKKVREGWLEVTSTSTSDRNKYILAYPSCYIYTDVEYEEADGGKDIRQGV